MNDEIDGLIEQARSLKSVSYDSPKFDLWEHRAKAFVLQKYGEERMRILEDALSFHYVAQDEDHAQQMHEERVDKAIEFLEALKDEPRAVAPAVVEEPVTTTARPPRTKDSRYGNITISGGTVIFGDGNSLQQVTVKQLIEALERDVQEKVPESKEKQTVLKTLRQLATSETFRSVVGSVISEILRRVVSGPGLGG